MISPGARLVALVHSEASPSARDAAHRAEAVIRGGGWQVLHLSARSSRQLSEDLTETVRDRALSVAAVVAVGGDGMVHLVLQMLHRFARLGLDLAFGLVPAGSGNDLARAQGLPTADVERAAGRVLRGLESPRQARMDLLGVECADGTRHVCATVVCLGLDARVNERANTWHRVRASAKYALALAVESVRLPARHYDLTLTGPDGTARTLHRWSTFVTVNNTCCLGGGMDVVPHADPRDGVAELFTVDAMAPWRFAVLVPHLLRATHLHLDQVAVTPVVDLRAAVTGPGGQLAYGDGERLGPLPATVAVLPAAVRVLF